MMRTILLYILLLLSALLTFSCKERPEVSSTLDRTETLIWESPDSALQLLEALPTSKRIDEESRARHALLLSQARYRCYIPTTSDSLINIALEYYQRRSEKTDELATAWFYKAALAKDMGCTHEEYLPYYKEAEALIPKLNDNYLIARIYHSLGLVNDDISHYGLAKEYYHKALKINENTNNIESQCSNLANLTGVYLMTDQWDSAQWCTDRLLGISSEVKDSVRLRDLYQGVGLCKEVMGEWDEAEKYYQKALSISPINKTLITLAGVHIKKGEYEKVDSIYHKMTASSDLLERASMCYDLYRMAREKGDNEQAFTYIDKYVDLSDALYTENNNKEIIELQHKYDLAILKHQNTRTQLRWMCILAVSVIILFALTIYFKTRKKKLLVEIIRLQNLICQKDAEVLGCQEEIQSLSQKIEDHLKTEKELKGMKNRLLILLNNKEKEENTLQYIAYNTLCKINTENTYNAKTDREAIKYCLDMTHKGFTERLDKACPQLQNHTRDICYLTALGFSLVEISQILNLEEKTIKQYMGRVCKEAGLEECGKKQFYLFMTSLMAPNA